MLVAVLVACLFFGVFQKEIPTNLLFDCPSVNRITVLVTVLKD